MSLNGWHRIGVILIVLWCVVGGLRIRSLVISDTGASASSELGRCLEARSVQPDGRVPADTDWGPCDKKFYADWKRDVQDRWIEGVAYTAAYTFIPIPILWLLVSGLTAVVRWVRAGFAQPV